MYAFLSYRTDEKTIAGAVRAQLDRLGIESFMAHEDIEVSHEWRTTILAEIAKADVFVPILSKGYLESTWCLQESGIAAFLGMCVIPLSIDGTIPPGAIGNVQSTRLDPERVSVKCLLPGLAKRDVAFTIDALTENLKGSTSYRGAEANFELLHPYLGPATDEQLKQILLISAANGQICHAGGCATVYLPPLVAKHGHLLDPEVREELEAVLARYA
jgi:hypothetical protein